MTRSRGFTLIEILVALAIIAVALAAGIRAGESADSHGIEGTHAGTVGSTESARGTSRCPLPGMWRETVSTAPDPPARLRSASWSRTVRTIRSRILSVSSATAAAMNAEHKPRAARIHAGRDSAGGDFGVISVLAYRATAALADGEAQLGAEAQRWRTLEALFTRFEADIRKAVPRGSRSGSGIEPAWLALPADAAGNAALVFTRAGAEFSDEPGTAGQRIGYRLRGHAVEIAYWPQLDNAASIAPAVYVLADGVAGFRVTYLSRAGAWRDSWPL
jgi:type II secretion system protein J